MGYTLWFWKHSYRTWPFTVGVSIKKGDCPYLCWFTVFFEYMNVISLSDIKTWYLIMRCVICFHVIMRDHEVSSGERRERWKEQWLSTFPEGENTGATKSVPITTKLIAQMRTMVLVYFSTFGWFMVANVSKYSNTMEHVFLLETWTEFRWCTKHVRIGSRYSEAHAPCDGDEHPFAS